jgi:hypothetical protein
VSTHSMNCWTGNPPSSGHFVVFFESQIDIALFHEDIWRSGCIAPPFLTSAQGGGEWLASLPGRFTPAGKRLRYVLFRRLGGPKSRSGRCGEEKNLWSCWIWLK